jgi:elongation factor Ts
VAVTMDEVKRLRDLTKAGMMDCKNALETSNGDFDQALKILKEKGLADAKKRSDRETKEGGVYIKTKGDRIAIALIGCETDFVSRNEIFQNAKEKVLDKMIETGSDDIASYSTYIQDAVASIKENIEFKKAKVINVKSNEAAATYIHGNNKIGVVAVFEIKDSSIKGNEKFKELSNNICLHIAANAPEYLSEADIPQKEIDEQTEIAKKQMAESGKPANMIENIIKGKIAKHFSELCLLKQKYVKDDKISVEKYVENVKKELNTEIKLAGFTRYMIG